MFSLAGLGYTYPREQAWRWLIPAGNQRQWG
jgi:hypothetical protein